MIQLGVGSLVFESSTKSSSAVFVPPQAVADLIFQHQSASLQCFILNACGSRVQADRLFPYIPMTVCVEGKVSDEESLAFSRGFYCALGEYLSLQECYAQGKTMVDITSSQLYAPMLGDPNPSFSQFNMLLNAPLLQAQDWTITPPLRSRVQALFAHQCFSPRPMSIPMLPYSNTPHAAHAPALVLAADTSQVPTAEMALLQVHTLCTHTHIHTLVIHSLYTYICRFLYAI